MIHSGHPSREVGCPCPAVLLACTPRSMIRSSPGKGAVVPNPRQAKDTTHRHRRERGGIPSDRAVTQGSQVRGLAGIWENLAVAVAVAATLVDSALEVEAALEGLALAAAASSNAQSLFQVMTL